MDEEEARQQALDLLGDMLGLDEFQRIVVATLSRELDGFDWPPAPGSDHERKLMQLGAIVMEGRTMLG